ncbi:putative HTH-type transcriptional regulator YtcD [Andreprevotia sp. IGB-42]|uniref:winged helix-turn-helix transcriptional regulator n=1 Tax=Andreprevotia sp. IGB-42 TaxID=2497473 RepID=UPI001359B27E|nr:helix-turn-helix domain-containing protein [Andreprevotia sp. IGB-42]KAF0814101.1 putative HTH-type transcriptional regulator YtcD [Andreprevotia sp. IGB-42]
MDQQKNISGTRSDYQKLEDVVGCKWSVSVLQSVAAGINRPGTLERHIAGISTKVLSERLRKLQAYGLLSKHSYAELPPRTEYALTPAGSRLVSIIEQIHSLDEEMAAPQPTSVAGQTTG